MIILQKPDIVFVLEKEGIALTRKSKNFWGLCPLHSAKTPSFKVNTEKQTFFCFGCNQGGDVISFIEKYKNLSFRDALIYLGIATGKPPKPNTRELKKRELVKEFKQWCDVYYDDLCRFYRLWQDVKESIKTIEDAEKFSKFYHREPVITYHMEILCSDDNEAKFELYREAIYAD
jgi:DNA primase